MNRYYKTTCHAKKELPMSMSRGITTDEYIMSDGRIRGSCYGIVDKMYDEALEVCKKCEDYCQNVGEEKR